ncbi:MAG: hypothetical protein RIT27_1021 [Pseudomonadota bacterium]|jgi:signal transduction histidine kinase/DNA-binding response OmpR family regulator
MTFHKTPLVLIVDDDATMRLMMRHTLKKAGFEVEEAPDGAPAIDRFKVCRPDVVLLDVMMPQMDGFTACAEIRKIAGGEHVPILMATGLDDVESINKAYEAGATDFITKPITFPLLGHRVKYVLRASRAIERVGKSEARLAHAQSIAHLGNWEFDIVNNKSHWSNEVFRIFKLRRGEQEPSFEAYLNLVHPDDRNLVQNCFDAAMEKGESSNLDHRVILHDGTERILHQQAEPLVGLDANGVKRTLLINGTVQDVTERKQIENELRQYRDHLEELVNQRTTQLTEAIQQIRAAKEQAEQANELKDKFISLVAHDLRSPWSGILSALEFISTDDENPLHEEHLEIVQRLIQIGKSSVQMIGDVLNVSRLKTGKISVKPEQLDGRQVVENVLNHLNYLARQKGVELLNEVPPQTWLFADPALYGEVVQNLTSNAIKFCRKGDQIRFYIPEQRPTVIAVEDSGVGIAEENLPKLFKIEEKTSTTGTAGEKGTGFGLPFSQDIMRAHDGQITVQSVLGKGTTFFVELPPNV